MKQRTEKTGFLLKPGQEAGAGKWALAHSSFGTVLGCEPAAEAKIQV